MENLFNLTPSEKRQDLINRGFSEAEVETYLKAYVEEYKSHLREAADVMKTKEALDYINSRLEKEGLVEKTKDKLTITNLRDLTVKPNEKGDLEGEIRPIDPYAPKKTGFHFKQAELDAYLEKEIRFRKITKEELYKENELLKKRIAELEEQLSKGNTLEQEEKRKIEPNKKVRDTRKTGVLEKNPEDGRYYVKGTKTYFTSGDQITFQGKSRKYVDSTVEHDGGRKDYYIVALGREASIEGIKVKY